MKVTILGATGQSMPSLFRTMPASALAQLEFALVARDADKLAAITRAIGMTSKSAVIARCHDLSSEELSRALDGADVVLIQIRYGGLAGRDFDERFPLAYECCGDESLGAGGLSSAWRTWPLLSEHLQSVRRTCRRAVVILLTGPSGLLARLASVEYPDLNVRAICELPMTTLLTSCGNRRPSADTYDYFGINHLGWIYGLADQPPIPLKYWRLHTAPKDIVAEQRGRETRAAQLERLSATAFSAYATGTQPEVLAALEARPSPWYEHAVVPLLSSLLTRTSPFHFFFSEMNAGWHRDFPEHDILEVPYHWSDGRLIRKPQRSKPPETLVKTIRPFVEYERLAAVAVAGRDHGFIEQAVEIHPWLGGRSRAAGLASAVVTQQLSRAGAA